MASTLANRLKREVLRNPAKAGVLGLLCLVAGYFWAPLVAGWFSGSETNVDATALTPTVASIGDTPTGTAPGLNPQASPSMTYSWPQIAASLDQAQSQRGATLLTVRDPFKPMIAKQPQAVSPRQEAIATSITPVAARLELSSTMISARSKVALVSGDAYRIGDKIPSGGDEGVSFKLMEVHPRHVVLERNGVTFELALKTSELMANQVSVLEPGIDSREGDTE